VAPTAFAVLRARDDMRQTLQGIDCHTGHMADASPSSGLDPSTGSEHTSSFGSGRNASAGAENDHSTPLKQRLRSDLTTAIKDRDKVRSGTIRMVLSAISEAEVAGAEAIELSEQQVLDVVIREAKKRREAEEAYLAAGRSELAEREQAERSVLADYLPAQLSARDISTIVAQAIERSGAADVGIKAMGKVMAIVTPQTKGKADGTVVAAEVRRQLAT
jgi:uncharacterized protein